MTTANNTRYIERGQSSKPKLSYGIGYNSKRKHQTRVNGKQNPVYIAWHKMIARCYSVKTQEKQPTYKSCAVDVRWHDFQDFADWYVGHKYHGMDYDLDKDLISKGSKIYSPDNCSLVPAQLNRLIVDCAAARGKYPQGVDYRDGVGKYRASVQMNGTQRFLGYYDTPEKAYEAYKTTKERHVKNMALKWANRIEWDVFVALMNWSLPDG